MLEAGVRFDAANIIPHGAAKQEIILQYDSDTRAQMHHIELAGIGAIDAQQPLLDGIKALDQPRQGRLARSTPPDNAEDAAGRDGERDIVQRRRTLGPVSKRDVLEFDMPGELRPQARSRSIALRPLVHDLTEHLHRERDLLILMDHRNDLHQRPRHPPRKHIESD